MMDFKITETGEYRTRDGKKAVVCYINLNNKHYDAVGYIIDKDSSGEFTEAASWNSDGSYYDKIDMPESIVAKWEEPEVIEWWHSVNSYGGFNDCNYSDLKGIKKLSPDAISYIKTRLTINPDGTKDIKIIKQEWK